MILSVQSLGSYWFHLDILRLLDARLEHVKPWTSLNSPASAEGTIFGSPVMMICAIEWPAGWFTCGLPWILPWREDSLPKGTSLDGNTRVILPNASDRGTCTALNSWNTMTFWILSRLSSQNLQHFLFKVSSSGKEKELHGKTYEIKEQQKHVFPLWTPLAMDPGCLYKAGNKLWGCKAVFFNKSTWTPTQIKFFKLQVTNNLWHSKNSDHSDAFHFWKIQQRHRKISSKVDSKTDDFFHGTSSPHEPADEVPRSWDYSTSARSTSSIGLRDFLAESYVAFFKHIETTGS